jgi:23S rRNA pseudouridine1911/1915/1917 synthase
MKPARKQKKATPPREFKVDGPAKLEVFLFENLPDLKKGVVRRLLRFKSVFVNNKAIVWYDHDLKRGDMVRVEFDRPRVPSKKMPRHPSIVYIDDELIVVEKPAGLLSVATDKQRDRTAYAQINEYLKEAYPFRRERVQIVHRLDRETSGLLLFARSAGVKEYLQENWKTFRKRYVAVVEGVPKQAKGTIRSHLIEDEESLAMRSVPESSETKLAITHYKVLKAGQGRALLEVELETGRKNQIRVHLSEMGHPIVGDEKYGAKSNPIDRLALHAKSLALTHPANGKSLEFTSEPPSGMMRLV